MYRSEGCFVARVEELPLGVVEVAEGAGGGEGLALGRWRSRVGRTLGPVIVVKFVAHESSDAQEEDDARRLHWNHTQKTLLEVKCK